MEAFAEGVKVGAESGFDVVIVLTAVRHFPVGAVLYAIDLLKGIGEQVVGDFLKGEAEGVDFFESIERIEGGGEFDVAFDDAG